MAYTSQSTQSTGHVVTATEWNESVNNHKWYAEDHPCARVYNSANISIGTSGVAQALTFNSERYDTGGMHSTVSNTGRLTVPTGGGGVYHVGCSVRFASNATGYRQAYLQVNGSVIICADSRPAVSGAATYITISTEYALAAADYVEVYAVQTSGGALNVETAAAYSPEFFANWVHN